LIAFCYGCADAGFWISSSIYLGYHWGLLIRFSPAHSDWFFFPLLIFSGLTIFMADLGANFEYDLRNIIVFSTLRQLGLIIGVMLIGFVGLDFFQLLTHALFKALIFMCAGVIIHTTRNSQDIRFMGNLSFQISFTSVCLGVYSFAVWDAFPCWTLFWR
jgi:NADH-ubiquinone oxidoreductase chain 5